MSDGERSRTVEEGAARNGERSALLRDAAEVARLAGDAALRRFRGVLEVETKRDGSPVTVADREAERIAREWIAGRHPADGILGEEYGAARPEARRRWIIDPIDGTKAFVRGVPLWGTLVAVAEGERILAGAAYFPGVGEMLAAAPGEGCWWNDAPCEVSAVDALEGATVLTTDHRESGDRRREDAWRALSHRTAVSRTWGDCYGYLLVATGRAEAMVDARMNPWDAAALQPIIEEAGGVFTDWGGRRTAFGGSVVATNAALAVVVREILND